MELRRANHRSGFRWVESSGRAGPFPSTLGVLPRNAEGWGAQRSFPKLSRRRLSAGLSGLQQGYWAKRSLFYEDWEVGALALTSALGQQGILVGSWWDGALSLDRSPRSPSALTFTTLGALYLFSYLFIFLPGWGHSVCLALPWQRCMYALRLA